MSAASSPDHKKASHAGRSALDKLWKCYPEGNTEVEDYERSTTEILAVLGAGASPNLLEQLVDRIVKASAGVADSEVWKNLTSEHSPWHHPLYREGFYRITSNETITEHERQAAEYNAGVEEPEGVEGPGVWATHSQGWVAVSQPVCVHYKKKACVLHANMPKCDQCFFDRSGCYIEGNKLYANWYDKERYDWAIHKTASEIMAQRNTHESDLLQYVQDFHKGQRSQRFALPCPPPPRSQLHLAGSSSRANCAFVLSQVTPAASIVLRRRDSMETSCHSSLPVAPAVHASPHNPATQFFAQVPAVVSPVSVLPPALANNPSLPLLPPLLPPLVLNPAPVYLPSNPPGVQMVKHLPGGRNCAVPPAHRWVPPASSSLAERPSRAIGASASAAAGSSSRN
ncbi:hypothetical protein ONZ51_g12464 [Trametes cubensis]|uniref:Uncharacterized protein n=1 Tax=Trametes cubensis TaxID=1111947 RepID=A0AAD7X6V8_9APHY|nr:hypothetical protein ONZ51_g12464 [Trametes cubensis]